MATGNRWGLLAIAWCVALNIRSSSIAVSPLLPLIKANLSLSYAQTGFLFAIPTFLMALFGMQGGRLADTIGMKQTITLGLAVLAAGSVLRATATGYISLMVWMAVLGAGMGIASPGLTRMVKDQFSDIAGTAMGINTSGLIMGGTLASWLTVPYLLEALGSWRGTFLVWGGVACLTLLVWVIRAPARAPTGGESPVRPSGIWRDKTVWKLNVIFLGQGLIFYSLSSWLPTYYHEMGLSLEGGSLVLSIFIIASLPSSLAVPYLSDRFGGRRGSLIVSTVVLLPTIGGLTFFPLAAPRAYAVVMGLSMGSILALTFIFPLDYVDPAKVGSAAGANLLVGYGGSFLGPFLIGLIHDLTSSFLAGWLFLAAVIVMIMTTASTLPARAR